MNILFLGAGKRVSLFERFLDAAAKLDVDLKLFTYELTKYVHVAPISTVIEGYKFDDPFFPDHLRAIVDNEKIDIIIPCMDSATVALSEMRLEQALVSDELICKAMYDKRIAKDWFISNDILTPKFNRAYPFIAKSVYGYGSRDQFIVRDGYEEKTAIKSATDWYNDYVMEEYIVGQEYTVDCYVGKEIFVSPRKRLLVVRGEVENTITVKDEEIDELCRNILSKGKFRGPITIQVIRQEGSGNLYTIEINPRFGGGVIATIESGFNYPEFIIMDHLGLPIPVQYRKNNLLMIRASRETFFENVKL